MEAECLPEDSPVEARVAMRDGTRVGLANARLVGDSVVAEERLPASRGTVAALRRAIPADDIALIERRRANADATAAAAVVIVLGTAVVFFAALAPPCDPDSIWCSR